MPEPRELPAHLGSVFSVRAAQDAGVNPERLRRGDLRRPFHGVRTRGADTADMTKLDAFARQAAEHRARAADYAPLLRPGQFFSHHTAAAIWEAPLPLISDGYDPVDGTTLPLHVSTMGTGPLARTQGVCAHRADPRTSTFVDHAGMPVADPTTTWVSLGTLPLFDLVAVGDFLCRCWRPGVGRRDIGRPPLTDVDRLRAAVASGRRVGNRRLREAVELVRTDSWSPRESRVRCVLVAAGLPEPQLNIDVLDRNGRFLACIDLAYPDQKIAIEYHGVLHSRTYAKDVERMAALRAAGWIVIEVTAAVLADPATLVSRAESALARRA